MEQGAGLHNGHSRNFLGTQLENGGSSRKPEFGKARAYGSLDRHSRLADYPPSTESYRTLLNRQTPSSAYHNVTTVDAPVASRLSNPNESSQASDLKHVWLSSSHCSMVILVDHCVASFLSRLECKW